MGALRAALAVAFAAALVAVNEGCETDAYCFTCVDETAGGQGGSLSTTTEESDGGTEIECGEDEDCDDGEACCSGVCADLATDDDHCGSCKNACPSVNNGAATCDEGECTLDCNGGYEDCDLLLANGCEAAISGDPLNCGGCGAVCLFANANSECADAKCAIVSCKGSFADCNGLVPDGCEVNKNIDPMHCGACGNTCPTLPSSDAVCVGGVCGKGGCSKGFGDCNGDEADGCEIDHLNDVTNCGACGNVCPPVENAQPGCNDGVCGVGTCDEGFADCDKSVWSGCETILAEDVDHCGACNAPCPDLPHGTPKCADSQCVIEACDAGFDDCDGDPSNGCEVNLATSVEHCGACGNFCPAIENGKPACAGFQCVLGSCDPGFADCFGGAADGCETNLEIDVNHCGKCDLSCPEVAQGEKTCKAGVCAISACAPSFADCDGDAANGCETDLQTDPANCGACNDECADPMHGTAGCYEAECGLAECDAGYSDCDGDEGNGCEFDTLSDPDNCGGCGVLCGSGKCENAACVCDKTVLLLADDSPSGTAVLGAALTAAGYTVTQSNVPSYQYDGTNPAPAGFGAIVLLSGGPAASSYATDMLEAGQKAIVEFVGQKGNGLVLTEWAAYHAQQGRWKTLSPLVLLSRTVAFSGLVTYQVDAAFEGHPIWEGLPKQFTFASTSNVGTTVVAPGVARIAGSPQAIDGVAIRDSAIGRVVHLAHAGNYAPNGWTSQNVQKLVANAVSWSARCQ